MSREIHCHPEPSDLMRYADGELSARAGRAVRSHLEICWQCRTTLEELQSTVSDCVRYRNELHSSLPSPPAPWMDIYPAFSRMDAAAGRGSFWAWLWNPRRAGRRVLIPASAAVAVVLALVWQLREAPSVQAAALLRKAVAAESAKPRTERRIRIRTSTRTLVRPALERSSDPALSTLFAAAHYDFQDPLSARSYQAWRDRLPERREEVRTLGSDGYLIATRTSSGELSSASLKLSAPDLRATEGRFEFRNREWVELAEILPGPAESPAVAVRNPKSPALPPARHASPVIAAPSEPAAATTGEELRVIAALHKLGADLGDPVEVSRSGSQIVVTGVGLAPERQQQIRQAIDTLPKVVVRFAEPVGTPGQAASAQSLETPATPDNSEFQQRLERQLGGRMPFERFSSQLLDLNDAAMARAYALRRLAQQFPPELEPQITADGRRVLEQLLREHVDVLSRTEARITALLNPVLEPLAGLPGAVKQNVSAAPNWQSATEELFQDARAMESLLAAMLDGSHRNGLQDLPSRLAAGLVRLRASLENYRRLLTLEPGGVGK